MTNTVFHTEDPKILQRQLAELELRLSTTPARLEQRSAEQLRLIRVEGGVTHDAQLDTFVRVDPGTATTTVVLPQPTAHMCTRGLAVLHVGTTGTVRVMAREGEVANASYVDVPNDALYTFLCDGAAWWTQKQNVVSITDGPGIDVTDDGNGNVTISNKTHVVAAAATKNIDISSPGTDVFDTVAVADGDEIWLPQQTTGSQNGPWVWHAEDEAMTRPTWWANAATIASGSVRVALKDGELWKGTEFVLLEECVVGTDTPSVEHLDGPDYVIDSEHVATVEDATELTIPIDADQLVRIRVVGEVMQNAWRTWTEEFEESPAPGWTNGDGTTRGRYEDKPPGTSGTYCIRITQNTSATHTYIYKAFPWGAAPASSKGGGYKVYCWVKGTPGKVYPRISVNTSATPNSGDTVTGDSTDWNIVTVSSARSPGTAKYVVLWSFATTGSDQYHYYDHLFATRQDIIREPFEINRMWYRSNIEAPAECPNYSAISPANATNATNTSEGAELVTITGGGNSVMIDSIWPGLAGVAEAWKVKARVWLERSMLDPLTADATEPAWSY